MRKKEYYREKLEKLNKFNQIFDNFKADFVYKVQCILFAIEDINESIHGIGKKQEGENDDDKKEILS